MSTINGSFTVRETWQRLAQGTTDSTPVMQVLMLVDLLKAITALESKGFVVTIEQRPKHPLAMGNYETVINIRERLNRG